MDVYGRDIVAIAFKGNRRVESEAMLLEISSKVGGQVSARTLASDLRRLWALGYFDDVSVAAEIVNDGADGTVLYHLASVVDDELMGITHVIRAEEHLSNTPRQIFIAQALGYELPEYAHLPVVAEPGSKTKLSKRKLDKYGLR